MNDIGAGRIAEIRKGKNCAKVERKMRYGLKKDKIHDGKDRKKQARDSTGKYKIRNSTEN